MDKRNLFPYLILLPFIAFFIIFKVVPIGNTFFRSLFDVVNQENIYNGFDNYIKMFNDLDFYRSILNTFIMILVYLVMKIPLIILFGTILYNIKRGKNTYLKLIYIPTLVGMFAFAIIYRYLFSYDGYVNDMLHAMFKIRIDWFGNSFTAQSVVAMAVMWSNFGFTLIMFLNTMESIPKEIIKAAKIDRASNFKIVFRIILPNMIPLFGYIILMAIIEMVGLVDVPMNLTGGAPDGSTVTLGYYIYINALDYWDFSYAATIGSVLFGVLFALLISRKRKKAYEVY